VGGQQAIVAQAADNFGDGGHFADGVFSDAGDAGPVVLMNQHQHPKAGEVDVDFF